MSYMEPEDSDGYVSAEDEDFDPSKEPDTEEPNDLQLKKKGGKIVGGRRGGIVLEEEEGLEPEDEPEEAEEAKEDRSPTRKELEKKSKINDIWATLNGGVPKAGGGYGSGAGGGGGGGGGAAALLASLNAGKVPAAKKSSQPSWMAGLGFTAGVAKPKDGDVKSAAAAALKATKSGDAMSSAPIGATVKITEKRRFAGKEIELTREVAKGSKDIEKAAKKQKTAAGSTGIDSVLAGLAAAKEAAKKVNILDKSRVDWGAYKKDTGVVEELEKYKKSGDKYLDKVDFLKRSELREYELDRDKRLQGSIRDRGRL